MACRYGRVLKVCFLTVLLALADGFVGGAHASGWPEFPIPAGRSIQVLKSGGIFRIYRVYRPRGLAGAAPLVVMLHGGFGDGAQAQRDYHWNGTADQGGFVVAYPDGILRAWNAGTCCGVPENVSVNDVAFITNMVSTVARRTPIDPARVYVTGMSNGAMMALRLGCQTNMFAAIAPVAGTLLTDCSQAKPTSVLQIHGTADTQVPYNGGPGAARMLNGSPRVDGPSVPAVNATWRSIDTCLPPTSNTSGVVTIETADCTDGRSVQLISVAGAGHQWPGGKAKPLMERLVGTSPPSTALDATDTIWQFFAQHHL
jgi:polyhydroxybutyrate depolymerase